jgi:hypothetical protein
MKGRVVNDNSVIVQHYCAEKAVFIQIPSKFVHRQQLVIDRIPVSESIEFAQSLSDGATYLLLAFPLDWDGRSCTQLWCELHTTATDPRT